MPKKVEPKKVGSGNFRKTDVVTDIFELKASSKDSDGKKVEFTYQYPQFPTTVDKDTLVKALTYVNSKKETVDGWQETVNYVNTAIKNEARTQKLGEINGILKLREDPEAAIKTMVEQFVMAYGVPREMAEANVRALIAQGNAPKLETTEPAK